MANCKAVIFALVTLAVLVAAEPKVAESKVAEAKVAELLGRRPLNGISLFAAVVEDARCGSKAESCLDCTTRLRCANIMEKWVQIKTTPCPANTPYCETATGRCSATVPTGACAAPVETTQFDCPGDGYWPDLQTCTKYYVCVALKAYAMDCNAFPGTVYDQRTTRCIPRSRGQCFSLRCEEPNADRPVSFQPFAPEPSIYAVCTTKDVKDALMGRCDAGKAMNAATGLCEDACNVEGRVKNTQAADDVSYYDCVDLGGGRLSKPIPNRCPDGSTFDADKQWCVVTAAPTPAPTPVSTPPPGP